MVRKNKILEGQGKVMEFYFDSRKTGTLNKNSEKIAIFNTIPSCWKVRCINLGNIFILKAKESRVSRDPYYTLNLFIWSARVMGNSEGYGGS